MSGGTTLREVNALSREEFVERFGSLFEHSPWVAWRAWEERPFGSVAELEAALRRAVQEASREEKLALIRAHPELAVPEGDLTPESEREQRSAGLDGLEEGERKEFLRLNRAYRERFGFPYVVCVREHTKDSILEDARRRLAGEREEEMENALGEIAKISSLRLRDMLEGDDGE
ncbi:MAG: 2-oxo-4-hydroxy-4-carboxy-5-ureidoimidazoline decarboxylase [Rubrobacteraceae bacterium]|nr:2-oxo-4-hydroxy-4-carboxy-5-ureidoimidazoline decarboxylase [Rubrobacteraceae bacterium]MCL6437595.1 2-oxo-4-hydroxy-4-carboxy-5-ureidoimidazoline decarboxylase [Rubrobacteraceae bacterium]